MADCECISTCPFFNGKMASNMPSVVDNMKARYCKGDSSGCARYMVFKAVGRGSVPTDLVPNQAARAQQIIAGKAAVK